MPKLSESECAERRLKVFMENVDLPRPDKGCWIYRGHVTATGYGRIHVGGRPIFAHRFSYELFNMAKIPADLEIDHLCRNRRCVQPSHLELVTGKENSLRGISPAAQNARKTHCRCGRPFSGTAKRNGKIRRICVECRRRNGRTHYAKARRKQCQK